MRKELSNKKEPTLDEFKNPHFLQMEKDGKIKTLQHGGKAEVFLFVCF